MNQTCRPYQKIQVLPCCPSKIVDTALMPLENYLGAKIFRSPGAEFPLCLGYLGSRDSLALTHLLFYFTTC